MAPGLTVCAGRFSPSACVRMCMLSCPIPAVIIGIANCFPILGRKNRKILSGSGSAVGRIYTNSTYSLFKNSGLRYGARCLRSEASSFQQTLGFSPTNASEMETEKHTSPALHIKHMSCASCERSAVLLSDWLSDPAEKHYRRSSTPAVSVLGSMAKKLPNGHFVRVYLRPVSLQASKGGLINRTYAEGFDQTWRVGFVSE